MDNTKNALAKLATNLIDAMTAIAETGLIADRHVDTINHAQRIIALLAKIESLFEKMNDNASNGNIVEAEELAHELHFAKGSMFENCRAIAEEECNN